MKKLIAAVTLLFAFTVTANAQNKKVDAATAMAQSKVSSEDAAKKDVAALIAKVSLSESLKNDMYTLMVMKHDALSNPSLSAAEKQSNSEKIQKKLLSALTPEQKAQVTSDSALLKQLTN